MRLELTRTTDLALRALVELEAHDGRYKGSQVAAAIGTTPSFISHVMRPLVRAGWVTSDPGPSGGYALATDLASINLLDLIEAVEGPAADGRCVLRGTPCPPDDHCSLHDAWISARDALLAQLRATPVRGATTTGRKP